MLRERDAHRYGDYGWPGYRPIYPVYRNFVDTEKIEKVEFFINDVPAKGAAEVLVSPVEILSEGKCRLEDAAITVNGMRHAVPFALESGEYAELEGSLWTHYAEDGEPVEAVEAVNPVVFAEGANECRFEARDETARAEVTLFAPGSPFPALKPVSTLTDADRKVLSYEAIEPVAYVPSKGLSRPFQVATRPGEKARLEFEILGPVAGPALTIRCNDGTDVPVKFETDLAAGEKLVCKDGETWKVARGFKTVRTGRLARPLPEFEGSCSIMAASSDPSAANARVNVVKRYRFPWR